MTLAITARPRAHRTTAKISADLFTAGPIPIHYQLAQAIEKSVDEGTITEGMSLESIDAIGRGLRVSTNTVRRAFQLLHDEAILSREVVGHGRSSLGVDDRSHRHRCDRRSGHRPRRIRR